MKYWEKEFEIETQKGYKFRFRKMSPIDIMAMMNEVQVYAGSNFDSDYYKKYVTHVLENTEVEISGAWIGVLDGNNYYPATLADDISGLLEITNLFFEKVLKPVFPKSEESTKEQK